MALSHSTRQQLFDPALEYVTGSGLVPTAIEDLREEQRLRQRNAAFSRALAVVPGGSEVAATIEGLLSGSRAAIPELARASTPGQLKAVAHEIASRVPMGLEMLQSRSKERELRARNAARRRQLRADAAQQIEEGPDARPSAGSRRARNVARGQRLAADAVQQVGVGPDTRTSFGSRPVPVTEMPLWVRRKLAAQGVQAPGVSPTSHGLSEEERDRLNDPALRLALNDEREVRERRIEEDRRGDQALALAERTEREARERRLEEDRRGDPALALAETAEREERARQNIERARWDVLIDPPEDDPAPLVEEWLIDLMKIEVDPNRTLSEGQRDRIGRSSSDDQTLAWYIAVLEESGRENDAMAVRRGGPRPDGMPGLVPDVVEDAFGEIGDAFWRDRERRGREQMKQIWADQERMDRALDFTVDQVTRAAREAGEAGQQFLDELEEFKHLDRVEFFERLNQAILGGLSSDFELSVTGVLTFEPFDWGRALKGLAGNQTYSGSDFYLLQGLSEPLQEHIGAMVEDTVTFAVLGGGAVGAAAGAIVGGPVVVGVLVGLVVGAVAVTILNDLGEEESHLIESLKLLQEEAARSTDQSGLDAETLASLRKQADALLIEFGQPEFRIAG